MQGTCSNDSCLAYNKEVIMRIGFGIHDLIIDDSKYKCPICKDFVEPITCGFNNT